MGAAVPGFIRKRFSYSKLSQAHGIWESVGKELVRFGGEKFVVTPRLLHATSGCPFAAGSVAQAVDFVASSKRPVIAFLEFQYIDSQLLFELISTGAQLVILRINSNHHQQYTQWIEALFGLNLAAKKYSGKK